MRLSLLEIIQLATQLVTVVAPIVSQVGKSGDEEVIPAKLPIEAQEALNKLATKAPAVAGE